MSSMPPRPRRCVAYTAETDQFFMPGVEAWLTGRDLPKPQGSVTMGGRQGAVYSIGALWEASHQHPEWPAEVRDWLLARNGMPTALVIVWD